MKEFLTEPEAEFAKNRLEEEMSQDTKEETLEYTAYDINWRKKFKTWEECKNEMHNPITDYYDDRLFFVAHDNDKIIGKPQLIHETIQRMPMIRKTTKIEKRKGEDDKFISQLKFIDDRIDKRYDGKVVNELHMEFWVYRIIYEGREYFVLSKDKLGNELYEISGMRIFLDDLSELKNSLKVNTISNLFIVKKAKSFVNTIPKDELIKFCKEKEINKDKFHNLLFLHPDGNVYDYSDDFNIIRKAQLLSSKYEGYPLHLLKMGPVGTGKTTEAEVLDYKFNEDQGILEAANSTLKSIVPSFKEKPANIGYICKCNRISIIDEMMKMVEKDMGHDSSRLGNYFGQMNMLLEQKDRMVGSGNDNSVRIKSTSKVSISTNNLSRRFKISNHLSIIDPTTLSRMLVWVQDYKEINKIYNKELINPPHTVPITISRDSPHTSPIGSCLCVGGISTNDFLTIYDSCQEFLVEIDFNKCKKIFDIINNLSTGQMNQVWRARGLHHTILLLDGITKHRCLFEDYDDSFIPKDEDYNVLERVLVHMVNGWGTSYDPTIMNERLKNE